MLPTSVRDGLRAPVLAFHAVVRRRAVRRVQASWALAVTASWAATVALTVVAYDAGGSAAVAVAVLARSAPGALAAPLVGAVVDRLPRAAAMAGSSAVCAAASAGAAAASRSLPAVVVLNVVVALSFMVYRTAQSAVMPELVDTPADLTAANVMSSSVEAVGVFAGPALAGALLALHGPALAFGTGAVLFGLAVLPLLGQRGSRPAASSHAEPAGGGLRTLLRLPAARLLLGLVLAQTVVSGGLLVLYAALAVDALGVGAAAVGALTAAFGLGGVVGSLGLFGLAGSRRLGAATAVGLLLWGVPLALVPLLPSFAPVLALLAVAGAANVLFDVTTVTLLQRAVPARLLGRAFGALELAVVLGLAAGALLAPVLEAALGPSLALAALGLPLVACGLVTLRGLRRLDRSLVVPAREVLLLRAQPPFALLPVPALERLALQLVRYELEPGRTAVRQGEPGDTWYVVDAGRLAVSVDGREVASLGEGEALGEIALVRRGLRTATLTAVEPTALLALHGEVFLEALGGPGAAGVTVVDDVARAHLLRAAPAGLAAPPDAA